MKKSVNGVTHWIDGNGTWKLGIKGFFLRLRGLVFPILINLPLAGIPFWWPEKIPQTVQLNTKWFIFDGMLCFCMSMLLMFLYLRFRVQRSLEMKSLLHLLVHDSRDTYNSLLNRTKGKKARPGSQTPEHERQHLIAYSNKTADTISEYFKTIVRDNTICCAIRIGVANPRNESSEILYITVGRSSGLDRLRSKSSEPVARSAGIPKFFASDDVAGRGILFYDDLEKASINGAYFRTKNDDLFKSDIKTMIVAPLNGWNGERLDLIGLLYITSKTDKILDPANVDLVKFTADHLAIVYSSMFARLIPYDAMPEFQEAY